MISDPKALGGVTAAEAGANVLTWAESLVNVLDLLSTDYNPPGSTNARSQTMTYQANTEFTTQGGLKVGVRDYVQDVVRVEFLQPDEPPTVATLALYLDPGTATQLLEALDAWRTQRAAAFQDAAQAMKDEAYQRGWNDRARQPQDATPETEGSP